LKIWISILSVKHLVILDLKLFIKLIYLKRKKNQIRHFLEFPLYTTSLKLFFSVTHLNVKLNSTNFSLDFLDPGAKKRNDKRNQNFFLKQNS